MQINEDKVIYKELSYKINGLFFKTHQELGRFRNEKQYSDYFEKLLIENNIKHVREYGFEDKQYGKDVVRCVCDFVVDDKIIIEFKAKNFITKEDYFQTKRYLVSLNLHLGIIVNFRQYRLSPKRVINGDWKY